MKRLGYTLAALAICSSNTGAQIRLLDESSVQAATAQQGIVPINQVSLALIRQGDGPPTADDAAQHGPFSVVIETPYVRAYAAAAERRFQDLEDLDVAAINKQEVVLRVSPGPSMLTEDVIEDFVIQQGETVIRPLFSSIQPTTLTNAMGATIASTIGSFRFPLALFAGSEPITLICSGRRGTYQVQLQPEDLLGMK